MPAKRIPKKIRDAVVEATNLREKRKAIQTKEKPLKDQIKKYMKEQGLTVLTLPSGEKAEADHQERWYYEKGLLVKALKLKTEKQLRRFQRSQSVVSLTCSRSK